MEIPYCLAFVSAKSRDCSLCKILLLVLSIAHRWQITSCHNWRLFIGSRFRPESTSKKLHLLIAVSMAWRLPTLLSWSVYKYQDVVASVHRLTIWSWSSLQPEWKHEGNALSRAMLPEFGTTCSSRYGLFLLFPLSVRSSRHIFLNLLSNNSCVYVCVSPPPHK